VVHTLCNEVKWSEAYSINTARVGVSVQKLLKSVLAPLPRSEMNRGYAAEVLVARIHSSTILTKDHQSGGVACSYGHVKRRPTSGARGFQDGRLLRRAHKQLAHEAMPEGSGMVQRHLASTQAREPRVGTLLQKQRH
jgi:hypothetical protein